jgi:hypothetical protein
MFRGSPVVLCGRMKGRTDMITLIVALRNFTNAPKNSFPTSTRTHSLQTLKYQLTNAVAANKQFTGTSHEKQMYFVDILMLQMVAYIVTTESLYIM